MPRYLKRTLAVVTALLPLMVTCLPAATALDPLPIPGDTNCTFSYGATVSPAGTAKSLIASYGGNTSCSGAVKLINNRAYLSKGASNSVTQNGPAHSCSSCSASGSHGGPYGPVSYASVWKVTYSVTVVLKSSEKWTGSIPGDCTQAGAQLACAFAYLFAPVAGVASSDSTLTAIAIATAA